MDYRKRIQQVQEKLKAENLDALVLVTMDTPKADGNNKNVDYLSGFSGSTGVVMISQSDAVLVVDGRYTERASALSKHIRIVSANNTDRRVVDFSNYFAPGIAALGITKDASVGFESNRLSVWMQEAWKVVHANLVPTRYLIESLRQYKDADEIAAIEAACKATCRVWEMCVPHIVAGKTEQEVAVIFDTLLRTVGAIDNSFATIVASGPNSASPHHETSFRIFAVGDPVTVDFGGVFPGGYCSDITRTIFVPGKDPDPKLVEIYKIVLEANQAALAAMKVGMNWKEYDKVARDYITEKGYGEYFKHGLGHSIGLEVHDPYNYADDRFEVGAVMSDEPGIYIPGLGGVRIEDDLVLTAEGARSLTPAPYLSL